MKLSKSSIETSGYTLIELLIGMSVIGIIFSIGFANFRDFSRRQAIYGVARNVVGELRLAQERSLSGQKPSHVNCDDPQTLTGFNFRVDTVSSYVVEAVCSAGVVVIKNVQLPTGIEIEIPTTNPILFKVLGEGTNIPGGTTMPIRIYHAESLDETFVNITASGEVK